MLIRLYHYIKLYDTIDWFLPRERTPIPIKVVDLFEMFKL